MPAPSSVVAARRLSLSSCTLFGNSAAPFGRNSGNGGGGILLVDSPLSLNNSIVAGNTSETVGQDLVVDGLPRPITLIGDNLVGDAGNTGLQDGIDGVIVTADPKLAPLGNYGGPTQTVHPLAGSPAILTSGSSVTRTDQRGFTLTGPRTIGAVKLGPVVQVGAGTLRNTLTSFAGSEGRVIRFLTGLDGNTITLAGSQLTVPGAANGLFLDASNLPNGLTISMPIREAASC